MRERIEDRLWTIRDENTEFVTRAMEAGTALTKIFEDAVAERRDLASRTCSTRIMWRFPAPIRCSTAPGFSTGPNARLPPFQEAFLVKDPRMVFCVMIDRNGYLPVHNKVYSHPQRPGDVAWNTANCRNRRIFNDPAGLAAGRNRRSYLIQSYARDMGNGKTVMMREIDVPIRVNGRHWGGFRTAYKL